MSAQEETQDLLARIEDLEMRETHLLGMVVFTYLALAALPKNLADTNVEVFEGNLKKADDYIEQYFKYAESKAK